MAELGDSSGPFRYNATYQRPRHPVFCPCGTDISQRPKNTQFCAPCADKRRKAQDRNRPLRVNAVQIVSYLKRHCPNAYDRIKRELRDSLKL